MENLEKVELVREKCNVSYEEARDALEACGYDVLDAIVMLERAQETTERFADPVETVSEPEEAIYETAAETNAGASSAEGKKSKVATGWKRFCARCEELFEAGMKTQFIAERNDEPAFEVPVLLVIIGLLMWGAALWLMVIGLFLGFRYRIESANSVAHSVNDVMDKAADAAADIKESVA